MTGQDPAFLNHLLNSHKGVGKVFCVLHRRHVVAHLTQTLSKGRTTKALLVEREVDMVQRTATVVFDDRRNHLLDVRNLTASAHNNCSRRNDFLAIGILLRERQRVFSCRHVDMQLAAEIAQRLHASIQAGILTFLRAAGPHPVGTQRQGIHALSQRSPDDVGQGLGHREHAACSGIGQTSLRRMTERGGDSLLATIVEGHDTTVAQWQLNLTLTLLTGNLAGHGAVYLVGEPILTSHGLQLEHALEVFVDLILTVGHVGIVTLYGIIFHDGLR